MSPAEKEARQMMADKKAAEANEKAYNAASTTAPAVKKAKGGSVTRGDGCATKGRTKGMMVKMAGGGKC